MDFDMNLEKSAYIIGLGFLGGVGISAVAYGLLFLSLSFSKELPLNTTVLFTVFSGTTCIFMALKFSSNNSDETQT
jgi:asparagine N-glycosylation enzyme membrane subunit Stt3